MIAVRTILVRTGRYSLTPGGADEPDTYAHVWRDGLRVHWSITDGRDGVPIARGKAWTRGGAMVKAIAAAHQNLERAR